MLLLFLTCICAISFTQNALTMKNETAQLEVTYRMSFPDKGKQPPPAGSESLIQKMDQIQEELTFMLHVGHTQSVFFSPYVFDGSDHIEQIVKNIYEAANVYYVDVAQQAYLTKMVFMGEEQLLRDDTELTWEVHSDQEKEINGLTCYYATGERKTPGWEETTPVSAWFTKDYPVPFGPADLHGLPGLILQGRSGAKMYTATIIKGLPEDQITIEIPEVDPADLMQYSAFLGKMQQMVPVPPGQKGKN